MCKSIGEKKYDNMFRTPFNTLKIFRINVPITNSLAVVYTGIFEKHQ